MKIELETESTDTVKHVRTQNAITIENKENIDVKHDNDEGCVLVFTGVRRFDAKHPESVKVTLPDLTVYVTGGKLLTALEEYNVGEVQ